MNIREELPLIIHSRSELLESQTYTRSRFEHAIATRELTRITKGHTIDTQIWENLYPADRHYAQSLAHLNDYPDSVLAAQSAAIAWGISTLSPPQRIQVRGTGGGRRERVQRIQDTLTIESPVVRTPEGVPTVTPLIAVLTSARLLPFRAGIILAESAVQRFLGEPDILTHKQLQNALLNATGRGCRTARLIGSSLSPYSESIAETCMRLLLEDLGIPYVQQKEVILRGHRYRADFLLLTVKLYGRPVILEVDGALKYTTKDDLLSEKNRQDRLLHAGYAVIRISARDAIYHPQQALQILRNVGVL